MTSNYALYIKEREGKDILENAQGFATYYFEQDSVYVADVYVRPEYRNTDVAKNFMLEIEAIGKKRNLSEMITFADKTTPGYDVSKKILLSYDFEIDGFKDNLVYFMWKL